MKSDQVELVVELKDGRVLSGTYHYLGALARLSFIKGHPQFKDFMLREAR